MSFTILRKEALELYQRISNERLKVSPKQIKTEFKDVISNEKRVMFVLEEDNEIKAFIIGTLIKNAYQCITYIDDIFVKEKDRNKGYGKELMKAFTKWSKSKNATKIRLGVRINNKKAIKLYEKLGYKIKHYEMELEIS